MMTEGNNELICALIIDNRRLTVNEVEHQLQINHILVYEIIHDTLQV
jgi:hypothetical protein